MTALEAARAGVVFTLGPTARITGVRGPKSACALVAQEVAKRAQLFAPQLRAVLGPPRAPVLPGVGEVPVRSGLCLHCGEPLTGLGASDGGCDLCHAALGKALRAGEPA